MSSKPHTDEVYASKRVPKNAIKFNLQLNEEQKAVKASVYEHDVTIVLGRWGTGKTQTACLTALDLLFKKHNDISKVYISRPIDFGATGYLKGPMEEKMQYHIMPIMQGMYAAYGKDKIDKLFADGTIQMIPINYMKGMNQHKSVTVIDEFEDINYKDFKTILTRLCVGSKLIFTGSEEQKDIKDSCIDQIKKLEGSDLVGYHVLTINHRNEAIDNIINYLEK